MSDLRPRRWLIYGPHPPGRQSHADVAGPGLGGDESVWVAPVDEIVEWLRGVEGEQVRIDADDRGVPAEDALAARIETLWGFLLP